MQRFCAELRRRGIAPEPGLQIAGVHCASTRDSTTFLAQCVAAWEEGAHLCLWAAEWSDALQKAARATIEHFGHSLEARTWGQAHGPLVLVATGGTSGQLRFAAHSAASLIAAAEGFITRFGAEAAATSNVLPLHHVGGFMTLLRALAAQMPWRISTYRELFFAAPAAEYRGSLSLVPTQLHRLLEDWKGVEHLQSFARVFVGGAALDEQDARLARAEGVPLSPCYGMTESAAMVTVLDPADFARGRKGCGTVLPHAAIEFAEGKGTEAAPGRIFLRAASLAVGVMPGGVFDRSSFRTSDEGYLDGHGSLRVTRRLDRVILSGGENVDPARIEWAMRRVLGDVDLHVCGVPDPDWGERVVALIAGPVPATVIDAATWNASLEPFERPKQVIHVGRLPRTVMGKIDREAVLRLV
jgi:O-succinylbenzoic acid--CoA ligase